jgi:hypothetical protein
VTEGYEGHALIKGVIRAIKEQLDLRDTRIQELARRVAELEAHSEKAMNEHDRLGKRISELSMKITASSINARVQ